MKRKKYSYAQIILDIRDAIRLIPEFTLKKIETRKYGKETYDLRYITQKKPFPRRPRVMLMGTLHGEEPAGAVALSTHIAEIMQVSLTNKVNLTVIPCGNPYGLDRNIRNAPGSRYMNGGFCHPNLVPLPEGSAKIKKFLLKTHATHYLDLHEDKDSRGVYVYAFKDRRIAKKLLSVSTRHLPIEIKPKMDDRDIRNADIKDGVVFDAHDGTTEDLLSHQKECIFSGALETPSRHVPMNQRARAQADAAIELIYIAAKAENQNKNTI
ncbi:MAG: succinylglutamate desuccinylase/aspartoacylase family protein [Patescibacteria group bacterium]